MSTRLSFSEKAKIFVEQHKRNKTPVEEAQTFHYDESTPWGIETEGGPSMRYEKVAAVPLFGFLAYFTWILNGARLGYTTLDPNLVSVAIVDLFLISVMGFSGIYKQNEGTFSEFLCIISPALVFMRDKVVPTRFRVRKVRQLYPFRQELEERALDKKDERPATVSATKASAATMSSTPAVTITKPTAALDLMQLVAQIDDLSKKYTTPERTGTEQEISQKIEEDFLEIVETTQMPLILTEVETPKFNCYMLSDFPLTAVSESDEGWATPRLVEFQMHTYTQKTNIAQKENRRATWGVFLHITTIRTYKEIGKEWKLVIAPVLYVASSDGQIDSFVQMMRAKYEREVPGQVEKLMTQRAYDITLVERLLDRLDNLTGMLQRSDEKLKTEQRKNWKFVKDMLADGLRLLNLMHKDQQIPGQGRLALFSGGVFKFLWKLISLAAVIFMLLIIIQVVTGVTILPFIRTGG